MPEIEIKTTCPHCGGEIVDMEYVPNDRLLQDYIRIPLEKWQKLNGFWRKYHPLKPLKKNKRDG